MKIVNAWMASGYEVKLPPEILAIIVEHVKSWSYRERTRTLSSCCHLSQDWYSATIASLYEAPKLTNKNFDKFARTICPPVSSRIRRIGLESLVRHLDMGRLAYESSKSLTARMLRRTKDSLETFVAPAVSFSINCLASLSKCSKLTVLDLSRDFYDMGLSQLLHAIQALPIKNLSLPRSAMRRRCPLKPRSPNGSTWPPTLLHLEISDWLPEEVHYWQELLDSFPVTLTSLAFVDCLTWHSFWHFPELDTTANHIKSLRISLRRDDGGFCLNLLLKVFPSVDSLIVPIPLTVDDQMITLAQDWSQEQNSLQVLELSPPADAVRPSRVVTIDFLRRCIARFPRLFRIDVAEDYLEKSDGSLADELDDLIEILQARVEEKCKGESGLFLN